MPVTRARRWLLSVQGSNTNLLFHWRILILSGVCSVLFLTQPTLSLREAKVQALNDRYSMLLILACSLGCQILAITEWAYVNPAPALVGNPVALTSGLVLMLGGLTLRLWAIRTLGHFFTATVRVQEGQRIVTSGPFSIVRHPSYLGSYLTIAGSTLFLESYVSLLVTAVAVLAAYAVRIHAEERTMTTSFGEVYVRYSQTSFKMIPGIW